MRKVTFKKIYYNNSSDRGIYMPKNGNYFNQTLLSKRSIKKPASKRRGFFNMVL